MLKVKVPSQEELLVCDTRNVKSMEVILQRVLKAAGLNLNEIETYCLIFSNKEGAGFIVTSKKYWEESK
jgi:hypothetical protein